MDTTTTTRNPSASAGCVGSVTGECIAKNDRLIAAAPELLEALDYLANEWFEDHEDVSADEHELRISQGGCGICIARAAISKAKGQ